MRSRTGSPLRLLLIEQDDTQSAKMKADISGRLTSDAVIVTSSSGEAGLSMMSMSSFDIVVADLGSAGDLSPSIEGTVTRLCKKAGDALVVALSDGTTVSAAVGAMQAGAHHHVSKPFCANAFVSLLETLRQRHGKHCPAPAGMIDVVQDWQRMPLTLEQEPARHASQSRQTFKILPMWRQEQKIIEDTICHFGGNISKAAAALEISPSTIYRKRQSWAELASPLAGVA